MSKTKRLQRRLDKANRGTGNTTEATDGRDEITDVLGKKGGKLYDKINPPKKSSYQGIAPIKGMTDAQARSIDEDTYPDGPNRKSALNMLGISRKGSPAKHKAVEHQFVDPNKEQKRANHFKAYGKHGDSPAKMTSPLDFKGANSSNSSCWKGYKKVGTKKSPSGTGETVNDCKKI